MPKFSENFMKNLVRLRKQENLTQQELADALEVNKQQLSEFERGRRTPNFEVLDRIAEYFQASPNQLFGTSQEIELENAVMKTDEYSEKAQGILKSVKQFESCFNDPDFSDFISQIVRSTTPQPMYNSEGEPLFWRAEDGVPDKTTTYSLSYVNQHQQNSEFHQAFSKPALEQLREAHKKGLI
jgi:transcriptional regulator with XRE-family HTH domain